jgi:TatD DNase family protein
MTRYFDSHAHFDRKDSEAGYEATVARAIHSGTERIMAIGGSGDLNVAALNVAADHSEHVRAAIGFDRDQSAEFAGGDDRIDLNELERILDDRTDILAIGEVGLDYHYLPESARDQRALFEAQLAIARKRQLPVIIHNRDADDDTVDAMTDHANHWKGDPQRIGVLHCYTGDTDFATRLVELGLYISFSGIVTFRNADMLRGVASMVPASQILIETDSPYLAPVPLRGKRNEPANVKHVAQAIADVRKVPVDDIARITWKNASKLFDWSST